MNKFLPPLTFFILAFLTLYIPVFGQQFQWTIYNTTNSPLPDDQIKSIIIDKTGNKWLGTAGGGLVHITPDDKWTVYTSSTSGLPDDFIDSIAIDKSGILWIATGSGVVRFDPSLRNSSDPKAAWTLLSSSNSGLPNNDIYPIAIDADDNKWIGTFGFGLAKLSADGKWEVFNTTNSGLPDDFIRSVLIDDEQNKWVGTLYGGLARMEPAKIGTTHANWTVYATFNSRLPNNAVWPMAMDEANNLWIGTRGGGIAKLNMDEAKVNTSSGWTLFNSSNSGLPDNEVVALKYAGNSVIWVGTIKGGAARFDEKNNSWQVFNTFNSALPSNEVRSINLDATGIVWLGTYGGGLARYDEKGSGWSGTRWDYLAGFDPENPGKWTIGHFTGLSEKFSILSGDHQKKVISEFNKFMLSNRKNVEVLTLYASLVQTPGIKGISKFSSDAEVKNREDAITEAHSALDTALSLNSSYGPAYFLKAKLFSHMRDGGAAERHDESTFSQALQFARKAVNLEPGNASYRQFLALLLVEERNFDEAAAVMKPVSDGNDPLYRLITEFREFNLPQEGVFMKEETEKLAKHLSDTGIIPDYPSVRVHVFAIPYGVGDLEEFFRKWFNEFTFFSIDKDRKNAISVYRQFIRFLDKRPFAAAAKKDLPMQLSGGIDLTVEQYTKTPGTKTPPFVNILIETNPATAQMIDFCKLTIVNYRR